MGSPKWGKITAKHYNFSGEFKPYKLYEEIKQYLDDNLYDVSETEVELSNVDGRIKIFTHLIADLEWSRRYYIKLAFSINMGGKVIDEKEGLVDGTLSFSVNGFLQTHSLLHEKKETFLTKLMTKFYDTYVNHGGKGDAIVATVIEMSKLVGEVKSRVNRR